MSAGQTIRGVWWSYGALVLLNATDLLFTYAGVVRGIGEANFLLRPILFTPWPATLKLVMLTLLALALALATSAGSRSVRILRMLQATVGVYLVVNLFHLMALAFG